MSKKRKWWQKFLDSIFPGWDVTPDPEPVKPVIVPTPINFPTSIRLVRAHETRDREWNVSFHGAGVVGEYDNKSRHDSRIAPLGQPRKDLIAGDWETLQAPTLGRCAAEKGSAGAPYLDDGLWHYGHKPRHKISLVTAFYRGKAVTFSADQNSGAKSDMEDSETGALISTLHKTGSVIAAVPHGDALLCALDGGERMTVVDTAGREHPAAVRCFAARNGRILAGGQDGNIRELVGGVWTVVSLAPLGGRIMDLAFDLSGLLWATTDKGDVWCMLSDGQVRRYVKGEVDYGGGSWFGPRFGWHDGNLCLARKIKDGASWRCVVERMTPAALGEDD